MKFYLFFLIFLLSFLIVKASVNDDMPLLGKVIVVDPGHGKEVYPQKENFCKI